MKVNTIVIYRTKYGSTKKYAEWIASELICDIFDGRKINIKDLSTYQNIIYLGGLYAGGILGFAIIKKNYKLIKDKKIIVVAVGATLKKEEAIPELFEKNIPTYMRENTSFFLLRGALDYLNMSIIDRFLMFLMVSKIKMMKYEKLDDDSKGTLAKYGKVVDFTNKKNIKPIIKSILN